MYEIVMGLIIALFVALLFLNVFFRIKVLKHYRVLVKNRVDFDIKSLFNKEKIEEEIIPKHPQFADDIRAFSTNIRNSVRLVILLFGLIAFLAIQLLKSR